MTGIDLTIHQKQAVEIQEDSEGTFVGKRFESNVLIFKPRRFKSEAFVIFDDGSAGIHDISLFTELRRAKVSVVAEEV